MATVVGEVMFVLYSWHDMIRFEMRFQNKSSYTFVFASTTIKFVRCYLASLGELSAYETPNPPSLSASFETG